MTCFKGFKTEAEAKAFQKKHGGMLTKAFTSTGKKSSTYRDYMFAVKLGGLDANEYPYCVQWNER